MKKEWVFLFLCSTIGGGALRCTDVAVSIDAEGEESVTTLIWGMLSECRGYLASRGVLAGADDLEERGDFPMMPDYERKLSACAIRLEEVCLKTGKGMDVAQELEAARTVCCSADPSSSFCQGLCKNIDCCIAKLRKASDGASPEKADSD